MTLTKTISTECAEVFFPQSTTLALRRGGTPLYGLYGDVPLDGQVMVSVLSTLDYE